MGDFIDDHKQQYGVELIYRVLPIAPSTYYRIKDLNDNPKKRSQRSQHDDFYLNDLCTRQKNKKLTKDKA